MFQVLTSYSPNPARLARQRHCAAAWRSLGVRVVALQGQGERVDLGADSGVEWLSAQQPGAPTMTALWAVAASLGWVLLTNSDIEPTENLARLLLLEQLHDDELVALRRWNHRAGEAERASPEQWGIDAFLLHANGPSPFEGTPFAMGSPWWDWYLPLWWMRAGRSVVEIRTSRPLLLHECHELQWSWSDWKRLAEFALPEHLRPRARTERFWASLRNDVTRELRSGMRRVRIAA